jgi:hypothetical protein
MSVHKKVKEVTSKLRNPTLVAGAELIWTYCNDSHFLNSDKLLSASVFSCHHSATFTAHDFVITDSQMMMAMTAMVMRKNFANAAHQRIGFLFRLMTTG